MELVRQFNSLIKDAVDGPNCIDKAICDGNCCFIHIDVPEALVNYYIQKGLASKECFQRGATFTYEIQVNLHNLRCIFYDKQINGCSLHQSGMKPPQCWVYPTGLDPDSVKTMCKKAGGWRIINPHVIQVCKKILEQYIISCKDEAARLNTSDILVSKIPDCLLALEKELKPSEMAGILLENENFTVLKGEGFNMGLKSICDSHNCGQNYFECTKICSSINKMLVSCLRKSLKEYLQHNSFKREYTLFELKPYF